MKLITMILVNKYDIIRLGHDFMGYKLQKGESFDYHHIIPASCGGEETEENGVPLCGKSSHPYIHVIERYDPFLFKLITQEFKKMKEKGFIDPVNLAVINEILNDFEDRFGNQKSKKGKYVIREEFYRRVQKNNY